VPPSKAPPGVGPWFGGPIWLLVDSSGIGGIERHIGNLAHGLAGRGLPAEVVLLAEHPGNTWIEQLAARGSPVRMLDGSFAGLVASLRRCQPRLLHTHGYKAGILGRIAARLTRIPVVSTFHSGEPVGWRVRLYRQADEWSAFLAQRIAVSSTVQSRLPYCSNLIPSFGAAGSKPPADELPRRVGFVGRLSEEKRPDAFCEIAKSAEPGLEWHIYGDGPLRGDLERNFSDAVQFHGMVTGMEAVWPTLGLLLMPSRFEALPLAGLEALAAGVPILASRVGDMADLVVEGKTGWLFDPDDLGTAQRRINQWRRLSRAEQAGLREACWARFQAGFSEEAALPKIIEVYAASGADLPTAGMQ